MVAVKGTFEQGEPYTDKNGNQRRSWSLWVEQCEFVDSKKESSENTRTVVESDSFVAAEEDIPF